jgi:prolyl-tRNA synthetase
VSQGKEQGKGKAQTGISPTRAEDYPEWYQQVVRAADMAENSAVRGCMVIKPWGYALWENMQRVLDGMFKATGHKNAYFPLFIPKSFLEREAKHVEGFAKECAIVTHHRLIAGPDGGLVPDPAAELEEPLVVRPTSETIIGEAFAGWVKSYRDLPLLINQWANVVRWELRTRLFLRTAEFLWQEGHTAHATEAEAVHETLKMLDVYADFAENTLAIPVVKGRKTEGERFPGAVETYCIEAMMQDRKALQAGTSHFLGQNFAHACGIKYQSKEEREEYAWTTSWGVSTRLIGALIMTHADDDGMIVPPKVAPTHVVILPIFRDDATRAQVMPFVEKLAAELRAKHDGGRAVEVEVDARDLRGGEKNWGWVKKGVPLRVEVGPRDVEAGTIVYARRDEAVKEKRSVAASEFVDGIVELLSSIQDNLFARAKAYRHANTRTVDSWEELLAFFAPKAGNASEPTGGFALAHWAGDAAAEERLKEHKLTVRCIPEAHDGEAGTCIVTGRPSAQRVVIARAY